MGVRGTFAPETLKGLHRVQVCVCLCVSSLPRSVYKPHSESLVTMETKFGERPNADASISSPQSEAVANELQELSLQPAPNLLPVRDRKNGKWQFLHSNQIKLLFTYSKQ